MRVWKGGYAFLLHSGGVINNFEEDLCASDGASLEDFYISKRLEGLTTPIAHAFSRTKARSKELQAVIDNFGWMIDLGFSKIEKVAEGKTNTNCHSLRSGNLFQG